MAFFEDMSRLKINGNKCTIFGINSDQDKLKRWVEMFDCEIGSFPSSHLGLFGGWKRESFDFLESYLGKNLQETNGVEEIFFSQKLID